MRSSNCWIELNCYDIFGKNFVFCSWVDSKNKMFDLFTAMEYADACIMRNLWGGVAHYLEDHGLKIMLVTSILSLFLHQDCFMRLNLRIRIYICIVTGIEFTSGSDVFIFIFWVMFKWNLLCDCYSEWRSSMNQDFTVCQLWGIILKRTIQHRYGSYAHHFILSILHFWFWLDSVLNWYESIVFKASIRLLKTFIVYIMKCAHGLCPPASLDSAVSLRDLWKSNMQEYEVFHWPPSGVHCMDNCVLSLMGLYGWRLPYFLASVFKQVTRVWMNSNWWFLHSI